MRDFKLLHKFPLAQVMDAAVSLQEMGVSGTGSTEHGDASGEVFWMPYNPTSSSTPSREDGRWEMAVGWRSLPRAARSPRAAPSTESGLEAVVLLYHLGFAPLGIMLKRLLIHTFCIATSAPRAAAFESMLCPWTASGELLVVRDNQ